MLSSFNTTTVMYIANLRRELGVKIVIRLVEKNRFAVWYP
jgi:hypothetical protein